MKILLRSVKSWRREIESWELLKQPFYGGRDRAVLEEELGARACAYLRPAGR